MVGVESVRLVEAVFTGTGLFALACQVFVQFVFGKAENVVHSTDSDYELYDQNERGRFGRLLVDQNVRHGLERGAHVAEDELGGHEARNGCDHVLFELDVRDGEQGVDQAERNGHDARQKYDLKAFLVALDHGADRLQVGYRFDSLVGAIVKHVATDQKAFIFNYLVVQIKKILKN